MNLTETQKIYFLNAYKIIINSFVGNLILDESKINKGFDVLFEIFVKKYKNSLKVSLINLDYNFLLNYLLIFFYDYNNLKIKNIDLLTNRVYLQKIFFDIFLQYTNKEFNFIKNKFNNIDFKNLQKKLEDLKENIFDVNFESVEIENNNYVKINIIKKNNTYKTKFLGAVLDIEKENKIRNNFNYNTEEGFEVCINQTSLFVEKNIFCENCVFSELCKKYLKNIYPDIYNLRFEKHE